MAPKRACPAKAASDGHEEDILALMQEENLSRDDAEAVLELAASIVGDGAEAQPAKAANSTQRSGAPKAKPKPRRLQMLRLLSPRPLQAKAARPSAKSQLPRLLLAASQRSPSHLQSRFSRLMTHSWCASSLQAQTSRCCLTRSRSLTTRSSSPSSACRCLSELGVGLYRTR